MNYATSDSRVYLASCLQYFAFLEISDPWDAKNTIRAAISTGEYAGGTRNGL
jgi:hypothetical protein